MQSSWNDLIRQTSSQYNRDDRTGTHPRTCLVGVGSDLRGDDSAGLWVARALQQDGRVAQAAHLLVLEGGLAPENHTGQLRAFHPDLVLLVDAAQMDEPPGAVQWIPLDAIDGLSASSHALPLSMLAHYLTLELGCEVAVLGIQPAQNELDSALSPAVRASVDEIVTDLTGMLLGNGEWLTLHAKSNDTIPPIAR